MGDTYYDVLGVDPDATPAEIRAAYRERVLETHPDQSDAPDAAERFARVSEAESVLTDETERARYDRLGHRAYQRWGDGFPGPTAGSADASTESDRSRQSTDAADGRTRRQSTDSGRERRSSGPTGSHHARQRYRRRAATATESDWWFDDDASGPTTAHDAAGETAAGTAGSGTGQRSAAGGAAGTRQTRGAGFSVADAGPDRTAGSSPAGATAGNDDVDDGFAVHGWTGDVDVDSPFQPLTRRSAFFLGCVWALYPLFVYSSLAPAFPLVVNAVVATCTLVLVGYLLTWPRVAMATFGFWSALAPVVLFPAFGLAALSLYGTLVWAAFWVPLVLATTVWWTLRP